MTPRLELRWVMIALLATCLRTSSLFADDPPKLAPDPGAQSADQGPVITPKESHPKPDAAAPDAESMPFPCGPGCLDVPYGFHFGYGYRPLGYAFWPRYDHYADFAEPHFADPYRFYRQPYQWHPFWSWQRYRQFNWYHEY